MGDLDDLAKHDNTVAIEERNTGETLAVLEGVNDEGVERDIADLKVDKHKIKFNDWNIFCNIFYEKLIVSGYIKVVWYDKS